MTPEQRRTRSKERLRALGVPVVEGPPPREAGRDHRPDAEAALRRAMAYALTGMVGDGLEREAAALDVEHWGLKSDLTGDEAAFLENEAPSAEQCAANSYRLHAAYAILWGLGVVSSLESGDPDSVTEEATKLLRARSMASLKPHVSYRPVDEILDEEDFYRLYSAAYATIVPPGTTIGLEPEVGPAPMPVVNERLRGLEWLLSVS